LRKLWKRLSGPWARRVCCLSLFVAALAIAGCAGIGPDYITATDYRQAEMLFEQGFVIMAREKAAAVMKGDPDYDKAQRLLKDINTLALKLSQEHMEMAEAYEKAGIIQKAMHEYRVALRYNPSNNWGKKKLALLGKISSGEAPGEPLPHLEEVKKKIRKARKNEMVPEEKAERHYVKGKLYLLSGKYNRAIKHFKAALRDMPDYKDADVLLRMARLERKHYIDFHIKRGVTYFQKEELEQAVKEWNKVLAMDPGNDEAADYKKRAVTVQEKLKKIKDDENGKNHKKKKDGEDGKGAVGGKKASDGKSRK